MASNVIIKISLVLLLIALIIFVVGFAAPYWTKIDFETYPTIIDRHYYRGVRHTGLWNFCEEYERWDNARRRGHRQTVDECYAFLAYDEYIISAELRASQLFETFGLIGIVATFVLLLVALCKNPFKDTRIFPIIAAVCCLASAGSIILGTIIFGSVDSHKDLLSWAFALTIVSGICFVVVGILILVGAIINV